MSYDLAIWNQETTITADAAYGKYRAFIRGEDEAPTSSTLERFYQAVTSLYPDLSEENEDGCPWDATLDRGPSHIILPIEPSYAEVVGVKIVELAQAEGLICFDPQAMAILTT